MITKEITSLQHAIVKECVLLREKKEARLQSGHVLISGKKMIEELARSNKLAMLFIEKGSSSKLSAEQIFIVTPEILKKITGLQNPEPIAAVIPMPIEQDLSQKKYLIALDGISDPGNMGTILRTALALGWEGALITEFSVDPFNVKALRAAKGATFRLPFQILSREKLETLIQKKSVHAYIADIDAPPVQPQKMQPPLLLIFGNESEGVSSSLKKLCSSISIPMQGQMESLNVAAASAILMYTCRKPS